jgi:dihydrofolate reductase
MRKLIVFNNVSLDGYFVDRKGEMDWAHSSAPDPEFDQFVAGNAGAGGTLVFGRITYELMAGYWPTSLARQNDPVVAEHMNILPKVVFSRTLEEASWSNTRLLRGNPPDEIRKLKQEPGDGMAILGSGSIVRQLAREGLIDEYQLVVCPVVLGAGRTMFDGLDERLKLELKQTRRFANGKVYLSYAPG